MSNTRLAISHRVIKKLKEIDRPAKGQLLGVRHGDSLSVFGLCEIGELIVPAHIEYCLPIYYGDITSYLPGNLNVVGGFVSLKNGNESEKEFIEAESKTTPLLLIADVDTHTIVAKLQRDGKYEKVDYEVPKETYWEKFIHFRAIAQLEFSCEIDVNSFKKAFASLRNRVENDLAVKLKGVGIYMFENNVDGPGITDKTTVDEFKSVADPKVHYLDSNTLVCELLLKNDSSEVNTAPVITEESGKCNWANVKIPIDALSIVDPKTKVSQLHGIILESVLRNLTLSESWLLLDFLYFYINRTISRSEIHHFLLPEMGHFITVAYPEKEKSYHKIKSFQGKLHEVLCLPKNRPLLRSTNDYCFETVVRKSGKILSNPHEGLNPSGIVNGTVSLVQGRYDYHHYMQDGMNDSGWGCAYRSLQTIFSWYKYQGFYNKPIPTHEDIQKALVSSQDKPPSFIGSREWIGSIEISYVLTKLLGVSSRILRVESGEEMAMKGSELSHHFKTQGSPVMIGGGQLAHTILGVDYNKKTGDIKFLVLDPHYTGEEDLSVIQGKGWCGWKGKDFWKKSYFYNLCLPQVSDSGY